VVMCLWTFGRTLIAQQGTARSVAMPVHANIPATGTVNNLREVAQLVRALNRWFDSTPPYKIIHYCFIKLQSGHGVKVAFFMKNITPSQAKYILKASTLGGSKSAIKSSLSLDDTQALGLTKKFVVDSAATIRDIRNSRFGKTPGSKFTLREILRRRIEDKLTKRLQEGFVYRQSDSRWVDQDNKVNVKLTPGGESRFEVTTSLVFHKKRNWKAFETTHTLYLNPLDTFTYIGGLLTIYRKGKSKKCVWYEQSRGFTVKRMEGYLIKGYHVTAKTLKEAREKVYKRLAIAEKNTARLEGLKDQKDATVLTASFVHRQFGFCMSGIRSFCEVNNIDCTKPITIKELRNVVIRNRQRNTLIYKYYLSKIGIIISK
jgi:hypothetical protein